MAKKKCRWYNKLIKAFFYDERREFLSRTAMMNFMFFFFTILTWGTFLPLIIWCIINQVDVKSVVLVSTFFGFITTITGGGFLQYSYSKKLGHKGSPHQPIIEELSDAETRVDPEEEELENPLE